MLHRRRHAWIIASSRRILTAPSKISPKRACGAIVGFHAMMQLMVDDLDAWWAHIVGLDLPCRFGVQAPRPPAVQPWGLSVAYAFDPSGVLWHVCQRRVGVVQDGESAG